MATKAIGVQFRDRKGRNGDIYVAAYLDMMDAHSASAAFYAYAIAEPGFPSSKIAWEDLKLCIAKSIGIWKVPDGINGDRIVRVDGYEIDVFNSIPHPVNMNHDIFREMQMN